MILGAKKIIPISVFLLLLVFTVVKAQEPYLNGEQFSFNKGWLFELGEQPGVEDIVFDDSDWRALNLPHDWAIEGPFDEKYGARTGGFLFMEQDGTANILKFQQNRQASG